MSKFLWVACWILIIIGSIAGAWFIIEQGSGTDFLGRTKQLDFKDVALGLAITGYHFTIGATAGIVARTQAGESVPEWLASGAESVGGVLFVSAFLVVILGVTEVANLGIFSNGSIGKALIPAAALLFYNSVLSGMAIVAGRMPSRSSQSAMSAGWGDLAPAEPAPPPGTTVCPHCKVAVGKSDESVGKSG